MEDQEDKNEKAHRRSPSPDVKSRAVVKYTSVQVPVEFAQLRCNTDLKMPPSNWLSSAADSYGLRHALSQSVGFSSFRMAHMFPDCVGEVDVVSGAECIKALLKLPYHPNGMISVMVHRIENTLLLDDFNILQYLMKPEWSWMKQFFYDNVIKSMRTKDKVMYVKDKTRFALQQKSLVSKFLYHSLIPSQSHEDETKEFPSLPLPGPELPEPDVQENIPDPTFSNHTYNRNVVWTFEDIQMLIGSDLPIFGGIDRPCVSLRLRDASEPINVLTGIDYWLDNLMCNVPEVVMCYHLDGIVQKYEPIKTEDLPNLENSRFSPKVIRNVAQNILSFLKSNATKEGHTYWLFKGTHDEVVKLYDLTSLCGLTNKNTNTTNDNPFTIPVAMLLYRVARNMRPPCQNGHIRMLLENCIKLLPLDKYPQIVASSHYMLANLYIPANTNPGNPCFKESSSNECECGDSTTCRRRDEEVDEGVSFVNKKNSNNFDDKSKITKIPEEQNTDAMTSKQLKGCDNLFSKGVTVNSLKNPNVTTPGNPSPPTVDGRVSERCVLALNHVKEGLDALKLMQTLDKNKGQNYTNEDEKAEEDPKMAKPFEPIPMSYEPLNSDGKKSKNESLKTCQKSTNQPAQTTEIVDVDKSEKSGKKKKKKKQSSDVAKAHSSKSESSVNKQGSALLKKDKALPTWQGSNCDDSSWNIHLKILFYEKTCLAYATMAEQHYKDFQYGLSFKYILLAKKCQDICKALNGSNAIQMSCLYGRAGDNFFHFSKEWDKYQENLEQIYKLNDVEDKIMSSIEKDMQYYRKKKKHEENSDIFDKSPLTVEDAMKLSSEFYDEALKVSPEDEKDELLRRIASIKNELGVKYMYNSQEQYESYLKNKPKGADKTDKAKEPLYEKYSKIAMNYLMESADIFQKVKDWPNLALLYCNTGRFMRFKAHCNLPNHCPEQKKLYALAVNHYGEALRLLVGHGCEGLRDLVKWELSTALYMQACLLQDYPPKVNDAASEVAEALRLALKNCPVTPGPRQCLYQFRAAVLYHRLASLFHNQYRDTKLDIAKRKAMIALSKINYDQAIKIFLPLEETTMYLTVQLEHVALIEFQAESNPGIKFKCLQSALELMQQCEPALEIISNRSNTSENDKTECVKAKNKVETLESEKESDEETEFKLLTFYNQRLQLALKSLIQMCLHKNSNVPKKSSDDQLMSSYKATYSAALKISKFDNTQCSQFAKCLLETMKLLKK